MLMVDVDPDKVERELTAGRLACPDCAGQLRAWGWARWRIWRMINESVRSRPRRSRCRGCLVTHVLLPVCTLARRADGVEVIGSALLGKAAGLGHRMLAAQVGRAPSTVRGWLRRFAARADDLRMFFTRLLHQLDPAPVPVVPTGSLFADALEVLGRAASAASRLFGPNEPWTFASAATGGLLLAPPVLVPISPFRSTRADSGQIP